MIGTLITAVLLAGWVGFGLCALYWHTQRAEALHDLRRARAERDAANTRWDRARRQLNVYRERAEAAERYVRKREPGDSTAPPGDHPR